jgi:serine protease
MRTLIATLTLALAATLAASLPAGAASDDSGADASPAETPAYVQGEVLVRFRGGAERLLELPEAVAVGDAAAALESNPRVAYADPNYIARAAAIPNDPGTTGAPGDWQRTQWNFLPCGSLCDPAAAPLPFEAQGGIDAPGAWDVLIARGAPWGRGARVAVLDTGVAFRSRKPRFRKSPDFSRGQFARGFDFVVQGDGDGKGKAKGRDEQRSAPPLDRDGHGTHVAGTIAERTDNGVALTGLVPGAKVIPVRVLDSQGLGTARDIADGVRFAAKEGADVINMSFEFSLAVRSCNAIKAVCKAIKFASRRGAVVVSAAGNSNGEPVAFPGGAPRVIGVGRVTKDGCLAAQSRTGAGLDLVAPGGGVPLTPTCGSDDPVFARTLPIFQLTFSGGGFRQFGFPPLYEGTSMAAAHVSGVAAMVFASRVLGRDPSPAEVECQLRATARTADLGQPYDAHLFGAGLVDAAAAVSSRAPGC